MSGLLLVACAVGGNPHAWPAAGSDDAPPGGSEAVVASVAWPADPLPPRPGGTVIVGAGASGLAAAMELPGSIVLEAASTWGGRSALGGHHVCLVGTEEQAEMGIDDSVALALDDWPWWTGEAATEATVAFLEASDGVRDRLEELGMDLYLEDPDPMLGRHRLHAPLPEAKGFAQALYDAAIDGIDLRLGTPATGLVLDERGVVGVETADGVLEAGTVVIAVGGFTNRVDLVRDGTAWPAGTWGVGTDAFATGQALDWAVQHGLGTARLDAVGSNADVVGIAGPDGLAIRPANNSVWIWVDGTGRRFTNEQQGWSLTLAAAAEEHGRVWAVTTHDAFLGAINPEDRDYAEAGLSCRDTWPELAAVLGVNARALVATVNDVVDHFSEFTPDAFGRTQLPNLVGTPCAFPWGRLASKSFGGLAVNDHGAVLDGDGRPIPGLYAVGEAAGMGQPGLGGAFGFDGSLSAVIWSGWRTGAAIHAAQ